MLNFIVIFVFYLKHKISMCDPNKVTIIFLTGIVYGF